MVVTTPFKLRNLISHAAGHSAALQRLPPSSYTRTDQSGDFLTKIFFLNSQISGI